MTRKKIPPPTPEEIIQRIKEIQEMGFIACSGEVRLPWSAGIRRGRYWRGLKVYHAPEISTEMVERDDLDDMEEESSFCTT